jgi:hypothetical protein
MSKWILIVLTFIVLPFIEHLFRGAGFVSLFAVAGVLSFTYIRLQTFLLVFVFLSAILDITFHFNLGTHLASLSMSLLALLLLSRVFPSDDLVPKALLITTVLSVYWIVLSLIFSIQSGAGASVLSLNLLGATLLKSLLGTLIYFVSDLFVNYTRGDTRSILKFR